MDSENKPTVEALLEEIKALQATVKDLQQQILEQKQAMKKLKKVFKRDWTERIREYEWKEEELLRLLKEEEGLQAVVEGLEESVDNFSKQVREKEEEARTLTKKVERGGGDPRPPRNFRAEVPNQFLGGKDAILIFPEEVWTMILGKLSDPADLWNCTNTCQLFEEILHQWKMGWLLEQALPNLYRYLPGRKLLESRQVCIDWYAGVNRFLEGHPSIQPHHGNSDPRRLDFIYPLKEKDLGRRNYFSFGPNEDNSILLHGYSSNPFIGRNVILELRNPENQQEEEFQVEEQRWEKLHQFLKTYGKEIWYLAVYLPIQPGFWVEQQLVQLLTVDLFQLVPNLKKLSIKDPWIETIIDPQTISPAPQLETLEVTHLHPHNADEIAPALVERFHGQLRKLQLSALTWELVINLDWPNLTQLVLNISFHEDDFISGLTAVNMPRLSKLGLILQEPCMFRYKVLLEAVNGLCATTQLNTLHISGPLEGILLEPVDFDLRVACPLKTLELTEPVGPESRSVPSFNFLGYFPFLENLNILARKARVPTRRGANFDNEWDMLPMEACRELLAGKNLDHEVVEVNKFAYDGKMYESNIWVLMPLLKVLSFQWDVYTREGYEAYAKRRLASGQ